MLYQPFLGKSHIEKQLQIVCCNIESSSTSEIDFPSPIFQSITAMKIEIICLKILELEIVHEIFLVLQYSQAIVFRVHLHGYLTPLQGLSLSVTNLPRARNQAFGSLPFQEQVIVSYLALILQKILHSMISPATDELSYKKTCSTRGVVLWRRGNCLLNIQ